MNLTDIPAALADIGAEVRRVVDGNNLYDFVAEFHDGRVVESSMPVWIEDRAAKIAKLGAFLRRHGVRSVTLIPLSGNVEYSYVLARVQS